MLRESGPSLSPSPLAETPLQPNTLLTVEQQAIRERLEDIVVSPGCQADALIRRLTECYLGGLAPVTDNSELDNVHRKQILSHPILSNSMFCRLLEGRMSPEDYAIFLSEYNNASMHAFYDDVLPSAMDAHDQTFWQEYIQRIVEEESTPRQHPVMFEEFVNACGVTRREPDQAALDYGRHLREGYTADLPFAAGYALGVEVEAGYEIALLAAALRHHFGSQLVETEWFHVHLADEGEVEHARVSVEMVERALAAGGSMDRVCAGFQRFCDDVHEFMEGVHGKLSVRDQ